MRNTRYFVVGAIGAAAALTLSACAGSGTATTVPEGAEATIGTPDGAGKTLTVWAMDGDLSTASLEAINAEFTKQTGAEVDLQVQMSWEGITTKVTTALATSTPPDVFDLGNTQIPGYAANGGLLDLTPYKAELEQGGTWLTGLELPATVDGKLYGVPSFAGDRAVIYNKTVWAAAGVTEEPATYDEFIAALDKVKAANTATDFSAFYFPGQYWYAGMQWVWDAGGDLATFTDGEWTAGLSSAEAQTGLNEYLEFQNTYSVAASQTVDIHAPEQTQIFADGKSSAFLGTSAEVGRVKEANPALTDADLGTFPFPGTSGQSQPVMIGGSDWGIAAKSKNPELALAWTKIAASPEIQNSFVYATDGWIPNSVEAVEAAQGEGMSPLTAGFFAAALNSRATPAAASWPTIEGDLSINEFFAAIASGAQSPADAAKGFDSHIESVLNGN
ncbi:extracellular solute-binding protein [Pengzhenrongella frigida]|uniref:Extracellular solute-binding protein n=1 Tax=Pengzhenrongella frigida TaxID=1259133 RepID=A0A4Q5MVY8_9MICO|nr:extracellular solute-binding protein [Cellulomonas sp. HLT2-17]RYV49802.1 extracellular solute-binding protein [Cellulomonas sp. HLT2-17]